MWWWTKVQKADIPPDVRAKFESMGTAVVSQVVARGQEFVGAASLATFVLRPLPTVKNPVNEKECAIAWLVEQRTMDERRRDKMETIEIAILVFVAIEALPIAAAGIKWVVDCLHWPTL